MTELEFNYDTLLPAVRGMVEEHTDEIKRLARRSAEDIVEIGQRLTEVKEALEHGGFGEWLNTEFGWDARTAQRFMQVAAKFKNDNLSHLNIAPSALYALASGSTPDFIRDEMVQMAQATGQPVTNKAVQERLQAHREPMPEPQEAPAPPPAVDNAQMSPKKKDKPVKAKEPYVPLPVEYEEREHEDGSVHLYPKLPTTQKQEEIRQKDWAASATRVRNAAYNAQVALGQLQAFSLTELEDVVNSQPGMQQGVAVQLKLLRDKMTELMEKWQEVPTEARTVDAEPLLEVLPPKEKDKSLSVN